MPLALADRIIAACSQPGDVVLDPFAGSGTTIVSAIRQHRIGIGFEINPATPRSSAHDYPVTL